MAIARTGLKRFVDYHFFKSAINAYLHRHAGGDRRPVFHAIECVCAQLNDVTARFEQIKAEFDAVAQADYLPYHEVDPGEAEISDAGIPNLKWNVFMLQVAGHRIEENLARCPVTNDVLSGIPNLVQAFFSILDPRKSVPLHEGPYLGYLRYHLGLRVPKYNPPRLIVAGEEYVWREGEAVVFDDSWPHEVVNESDEPRVVLIVDILRPLPPVPYAINNFVTGVIASRTYGRKVASRVRGGTAAGRDTRRTSPAAPRSADGG
jgi:aspartyl/asparaginyl beta-hydroxylase (cupin superfamily)